MKFKFSKNLVYQLEAIDSIVNIFDTGKNFVVPMFPNAQRVLAMIGATVANSMDMEPERILKNIQAIQKKNGIESVEELESLEFSIEMETGTGKTYETE